MRLEYIEITNFLGYDNARFDFDDVAYVLGHNGVGKSSLRDAVLYALTGTARSTDKKGIGAEKLIRNGGDEASIQLKTSEFLVCWWIHRTTTGCSRTIELIVPDKPTLKGEQAKVMLDQLLGAPREVVRAVLDGPSWFSLPADRRSEILSEILGTTYELSDVVNQAQLSEDASSSLIDAIGKLTKDPEHVTPDMLATIHDRCFTRRKDAKRELGDVEEQARMFGGLSVVPAPALTEKANADVAALDKEQADLNTEIGRLQAKGEERARILQQIEELKAEENAATQERPPGEASAIDEPGEDLASMIADLERTETSLQEKVEEKKQRLDDAKTTHEVAKKRIESIEQGDTACPSIHAPEVCPISKLRLDADKKKLPRLKKELAVLESNIGIAKTYHTEAVEALASCKAELKAQRERQLEQASRVQQVESSADAAGERIAILTEQLEALPDVVEELRVAEARKFPLSARLKDARSLADEYERACSNADQREALNTKIANLKWEIGVLHELVTRLDPKSLPAELLAKKTGPLVNRMNVALMWITNNEYSAELVAGAKGGLDLIVRRSGGYPLEAANLSDSEQIRIGAALGVVFADLTDVEFVIIDRVDALSTENRGRLIAAVPELGIKNMVLLATKDFCPFRSDEGEAVYWVADGSAFRVETAEDQVRTGWESGDDDDIGSELGATQQECIDGEDASEDLDAVFEREGE